MQKAIGSILLITISVFAIFGYLGNIFAVFSEFDVFTTGEAVIRVSGIFIPIIGAIMGWI